MERKSLRTLIGTSYYNPLEDFSPPDPVLRNRLTDRFFILSHELKEWAHKVSVEAFEKKQVRRDLVIEFEHLNKQPGVQFNAVFELCRIEGDGKPPSRIQILDCPYNVLYQYDAKIDGPLTSLLKSLHDIGESKAQGNRDNKPYGQPSSGDNNVINISSDTASSIVESCKALIKSVNETKYSDSVEEYNYIKATDILHPNGTVSRSFLAAYSNIIDTDRVSVISYETEQEI